MIKDEYELLYQMRTRKAFILDIYDNRNSEHTTELEDYTRDNTYDTVSKKLIYRLLKNGVLKMRDASKCLELDETTFYLPEQELELFNL